MRYLNKKDIVSAVMTGLTTGVIGWRVLVFLGKGLPLGVAPSMLVWLVPILWVLGVQLGYALALLVKPFAQFGKFAAIGFANASVDFGILYALIAATGQATGWYYTVFKSMSFSVAVVHSYFWNKYWAFDAGKKATTGGELASFASVSLVSLAVNVAIASAVVALGPLAGLETNAWAGVAAIAGSATALILSFIGFRMFVFAKS